MSTVVAVVMLSASVAAADPSEPRTDASTLPVWFTVVSDDCQAYATIPADAGDVLGWNHLLSLATCLQVASIPRAPASEDLAALVANLDNALAPSATLNLYAIQYGPATVKLRAAYQIGMAYVALMTRARITLVAPPEAAVDAAAAKRYVERHAELEVRLESARHAARLAFAAIDQVAAEAPRIARDPVTAGMVRSARAVLPIFGGGDEREDHTTTASLPSR